jgi:aldose 1-epimerase
LEVKKELFDGNLQNNVWLFSIVNKHQHIVQLTNYGGIVHSWICPDLNGNREDILLGCGSLVDYIDGHPYFGCIVGRFGNRITKAHFTLNEQEYSLTKNLNEHHLHGGVHGFDKKIWDYKIIENDESISIELATISYHLEEGYPGNLKVKVVYNFNENNELSIEYFAESDQDTHINLTNHCYFNLSGKQDKNILDHWLQINSNTITETNEDLFPTGKIISTYDTVLDFSKPRLIGCRIFEDNALLHHSKGYDHNYILLEHDFKNSVAEVYHRESGRVLTVFTNQPAIQLYTGNWLGGIKGKNRLYQDYNGFCLETQHYPDTPNHAHFPTTVLKKGAIYNTKTIYKLDLK